MRALLVAPPGTPAIAEVAAPLRQRGEVLVEVHHAAIDSGDAAVSAGVFHELGYIERATVGLGWDFAGTVTESDPSSEFRPGQRVVGVIDTFDKEVGAVSEYVSVPEDALTHLPDGVSSEEGAVVPVAALTALQALATLGEERGSLLVTGAAGMVGGFAIAIARELGFAVTGLARDHDRAFVESTGVAFVDGLAGSYDAVFDTAQLGTEALAVVADGGAIRRRHARRRARLRARGASDVARRRRRSPPTDLSAGPDRIEGHGRAHSRDRRSRPGAGGGDGSPRRARSDGRLPPMRARAVGAQEHER